ncbi:hypothetical protein FHP29_06260 [Nocardioides albidus]|uniref:Carboxypeptidase regulatory-like domain-containing protein n=1 Tax=Nocardioides albidus TaxID=1517589 RepID=A0A5C4W5E8_9ACTN|nr:hypothetical protein [Nocardioides albidus]TNM43293.1 hypothetical protein FHP29_06260 [Nocardioides albidus]
MRLRSHPRPASLLPVLLGLLLALALVPVLAAPARAATITVTGKVTAVDTSGATVPVPGVFVDVWHHNAGPVDGADDYTAVDGTYQVTLPASGTYEISMECRGVLECAPYAPEPVVVRAISASAIINATLERWGRITGTLKKNGTPISWPNGEIAAHNQERSWDSPQVSADASGRFTIDKVAPGVVEVEGREPWGGEQFLSTVDGQRVTVAPGQTSDISLAVEDWPGLYVRAVDAANSTPLAGLRWNVFSRPVGSTTWDAGLQMGPLRTNTLGRMNHPITDKTLEYTVCFYDDAEESTATVRRPTRCLGNAPSLATAQAWKHTAAQPKLKVDLAVPLPFTTAAVPAITGTAKVGTTLTATPGTWSPSATFSYQWLRAGAPISGATTATYVPVVEDLGKALTVRVTGSRQGYVTTAKTSAATAAVAAGGFTTAPVPTITGTAKVGTTLTAIPGTWSPSAAFAYQWLRAGVAIQGATTQQYQVTAADAGKALAVRVTGTRTGYVPTSRTSATTPAAADGAFTDVPVPTITGTTAVGATLTADAGVWTPAATTTTYQWLRSGVEIPGATGPTYRLTPADAGRQITVRVRGERSGYAPDAATSAPTAAISQATFTTTSQPKIKGRATVGAKLRAVLGVWSPQPATTTYQWYRNGKAIKGATKAKYKTKAADRRKRITVVVTRSLAGYATVTVRSAATKRIS